MRTGCGQIRLAGTLSAGLVALVGVIFGGCESGVLDAQGLYRSGDIRGADTMIRQIAPKAEDGPDALLVQLELGHMLRATGAFEESTAAFVRADEMIAADDENPTISLTDEGFAALTNLSTLPYRATEYDRVMVSVYRALNYLSMNDVEGARPEIRGLYFRQVEAVQRNEKRIDEAEAAAEKARESDDGYDVERAMDDPVFAREYRAVYGDLARFEPYADFVNPFAELLQGIYYLGAMADPNDAERARTAFRRTLGMAPENPFLPADIEAAEAAGRFETLEPTTWVVFATGVAPARDQVTINIPLFLFSNEVDYAGASFPKLVFDPRFAPTLVVETSEGEGSTALVCDMDRVIAADFDNQLPVIVVKTLIGAATKVAIAWGANEATEGTDWVNALVRLGILFYQLSQNKADLRTWSTLPKQFQYARIPTPEDGLIELRPAGRSSGRTVEVEPGHMHLLYVRSIRPGTGMIIHNVQLR